MSIERTVQGLAADGLAAVSAGGATLSWITMANEVFQLVATLIAIVAGIFAIRWHRIRIKLAKEKLNVKSNRKSAGGASRSTGRKSLK